MKKVLVVGCGLSGAVVARELVNEYANVSIEIWERRNHIAGNMYDFVDPNGILVQKYGPHTFHTKKKYLFDYICQYGEWKEFFLTCRAEIFGIQTPSPFNFKSVDDFFCEDEAFKIKQAFKSLYNGQRTISVVQALKSNENNIRRFAEFLFENDYKLYSAKQWGCLPEEIDPSILERVPIRLSYDDGYFDDPFQVMPKTNYVDFFKNLLNHPRIKVILNKNALDYLRFRNNYIVADNNQFDLVVFTGALDELFDCKYGRLPYRSLRFEWKYSDIDSFQDAPVVAYPQEKGYTRITEYKKLPVQNVKGTTYAIEYSLPYTKGEYMEPYYPILSEKSDQLYKKYKNEAGVIENLVYCGRLADFKYFNMDQALDNALAVAHSDKISKILGKTEK